jgi:hypothetical protein
MTDNLSLDPEANINFLISTLKASPFSGPIADQLSLAPGVTFSLNPPESVAGTVTTGEGAVVKLQYQHPVRPNWFSLQMMLGGVDLSDKTHIGLVVKSSAPEARTFRACLRSSFDGSFVDCFFKKHIVSFAETSVHFDVISLAEAGSKVPTTASWRDLILFFGTKNSELTIQDIKVFTV